ncbi:MAG TPA: PEP-CTERM sorting domain-containing protein [Bryobacteraceae bacterium]|jgi:hypothetical protein
MRLMRQLLSLACVLTTASIIVALRHKAKNTIGNHVAVPGVAVPGSGGIAAARPSRRMYPYSVIPGGAHDRRELRTSIGSDALVREHYRDFALDRVRVVVLQEGRREYVSFRMAGQIFWTKKPLLIPKGETLLTDGIHYARTRCGNRLSETAQARTTPFEPDPKVLNSSSTGAGTSETPPRAEAFDAPDVILEIPDLLPPTSQFTPVRLADLNLGDLSLLQPYSAAPGLAAPYFSGGSPLQPGTAFEPGTPFISTPEPVLPADVPEPATLFLLGLAGIFALRAIKI